MADEGLIPRSFFAGVASAALAFLAALGSVACGDAVPPVQTANVARPPEPPARPYPEDLAAWGDYHARRFGMRVPLPSPQAWTFDDAKRAELVATQGETRSKLVILLEDEPGLVNHMRCEARARVLGLVPEHPLRTVEDTVTVGPEAFDTRVLVGIEPGAADGPLRGHVLGFGAYVRKCLFFHLTTEVSASGDEQVLSQRLALVRLRTLAGIKLDALDSVPREKEAP